MIVPLDTLKRALGWDVSDTTDDTLITEREADAVAWVEKQTHEHRFRTPEELVEVLTGKGSFQLVLPGHVDDDEEEVTIRERILPGDWETLDPAEDFERRKDTLIRLDGQPFYRGAEYEITYPDGYETAPHDIQAVVIELVGAMLGDASSGGLSSETIGDYSYKTADAVGASLSDVSLATIQRYRRMPA